ncbi:hypothetical protein [Synechococcus sp. RS9916]|uniref:hypothetical protein n=1 Tax=Synechococcus sp. RS9916 TaxID=221359 RepID=UPI00056DCB65|nr:hypothetical protein [Synechococcus sp. RS9916]
MQRAGFSRVGIGSAVLSIVPFALLALYVASAPVQTGWLFVPFIVLFGLLLEAVAFSLGLLGLSQSSRERITAFCGTMISTTYFVLLGMFFMGLLL